MVKGRISSAVMLQEELNESTVQNAVIHLAMHAFSNQTNVHSPYLLLEASQNDDSTNRLYDYEINSMKLSNPMVVLSSCETGSGQLQTGEGIISLSRSFLLAGAASVVHTLWPAEDLKAQQVMIWFYKELKRGKSKAKALSLAKRHYLAHSPPSYAHPYYWAAYQITGNPDPLKNNWNFVMFSGILLVFCMGGYFLIRRIFFSRSNA
jgi:CHAT domain-containing protein